MSVAGIKTALGRDPLLGARIDGRYRIRAVHGRGGMGIVYSAVHEDLRRDVAVKVLDKSWATDRMAIERFLQEARTASGLSHGNIVDVLDLGRLPDGRPYLVMPLIIGSDLATVLAEQGPQHPKRVASLLGGVASALDLIHAKGLVHHDIKPENLMRVLREDGSETVVVLDFGIAGARFPLDGRGLELFDRGTPEFMPPEAAAGVVPDRRGDIYALATVAFELMTGRLPFESNDDAELATLKATRPPSSMTYASGMSFPLALEAVVARGLATRPAERYATAGEFVRRLAHVAAQIDDHFLTREGPRGTAGPVLQPPTTRPQRRAVTSRSRTLMAAAGGLAARVSAPPSEATPVDTPAPEAGAPAGAPSATAQTLPQMHAVSTAPAAPGDSAPPSAEASAEASGARALPRAGDAERSSADTRPSASSIPSKTATLSPGLGPLMPIPSRSTLRTDPLAATSMSPSAAEPAPAAPPPAAPASESGPATILEWGPAEASGTFLRDDARADAPAAPAPAPGPAAESASAAPGASAAVPAAAATPAERPRVSAPYSITQPHGSVTAVSAKVDRPSAAPSSERSSAERSSSERPTSPGRNTPGSRRNAGPRISAPPISAPPPASTPAHAGSATDEPEDDAVLVVDANDTTATPFPPPPAPADSPSMAGSDFASAPSRHAHAARPLPEHDDIDDQEDDDSEEVDALYAMAQRDDRITDPAFDFRPRRSVLLHPAMLIVYACAALFWLYAALGDSDPHSAALPAPVPVRPAPYSPPAPSAASPPAPSIASPVASPPAASASPVAGSSATSAVLQPAAQPAAPAAAPEPAPSALRPTAEARPQRARSPEPAAEPAPPAVEARVRRRVARAAEPVAPAAAPAERAIEARPARDDRSAAELTREAENAILRGDTGGAAELYERAIAADSSYAPAFRGKGLVMERLGKTQKAADAFRTFLRLAPDSPSAAKIRDRLEALE